MDYLFYCQIEIMLVLCSRKASIVDRLLEVFVVEDREHLLLMLCLSTLFLLFTQIVSLLLQAHYL